MKKGIAESFKETLPLNANFHVQMRKIYYSNFPDLVTLKPNISYHHSYLKKASEFSKKQVTFTLLLKVAFL